MNTEHLKLCSSVEWADAVERWIIPWVLDGVPTFGQQNAVLSEIHRLLRPGGVLAGEDSLDLRRLHQDDTYAPVDPEGLPARLEAAGFIDVSVDTNEFAVRFRATKPLSPTRG